MKHTIASSQVVAQTARAGILLAFFGGLACSSSDNTTSGQTAAGGGASTGGQSGSGATGGTVVSSGGCNCATGGQAPDATGGSVANGTGGTNSSATGGTVSNSTGGSPATGGRTSGASATGGTLASSTGGTKSSATGGTVSNSTGGGPSGTGGTSVSTGGSGGKNSGGSTARGTGGLNGTGGHSGGASGATGGSSAAGSTSTSTFDPCPATGNCKILPLGDSITAGAGADTASPNYNGGYRVELFTKAIADQKHITFVGSLTGGPTTVSGQAFPKNHEGHIGWTITQINGIATTAQALKDMPQIVLLFIGTNDEGYASSEAGASDRLATLIDKIVAAVPDALLVVSSIYPFPGCNSTGYTPTQCAANVATYDAAIPGIVQTRAVAGKHVLYVDMSTLPTGALSTDNVHPNYTVGYPWMGDTWYGVIKSYLH
jgi:hypothetical protein